jgi:hypothetical protein
MGDVKPDRVQYWVFPAHSEGRPTGEPSGPFYSTAEAIDHLPPGGVALAQVAIAGTWRGPQAGRPVRVR